MPRSDVDIHHCARAIIIDGDHILLAYDPRANPFHYYELNKFFYYLPGGHIDFGESPSDAVTREILEETGFRADNVMFLSSFEYKWNFEGDHVCCHTHEINFIFRVEISSIDSHTQIEQIEPHVAFKWLELKNLAQIDLRPTLLKELIFSLLSAY